MLWQTALEYKGHGFAQFLLAAAREDGEKEVKTSAIDELVLCRLTILCEHAQTHNDAEVGVAIKPLPL